MIFKKKEKLHNQIANVSLVETNTIVSEQFKMVRTNIEFSSIDEEIRTMVITSVNPGAGKSTISANLARTFASQDKRVLLIDADMRKPMVNKVFNLGNQLGLSTLFTNKNIDLNDAIQESDTENLSILTSGVIPPNPSEMLSSKKMTALIEECKEQFDLIIFDMPPLTAVADAQIMSGKADGTVLVLRRGVDNKDHIRKCKELVKAANANVIGAIFNREKDKDDHYYYYQQQ